MNKAPLHEKIEAYLLDRLPPREAREFAASIAADSGLAQQVELQQAALLGMERLAATELLTRFQHWDRELDQPSAKIFTKRHWLLIGIAVVLLLALIGFLLARGKNAENQQKIKQMELQIAERDSLLLQEKPEQKVPRSNLDSAQLRIAEQKNELRRLQQQLADQQHFKKQPEIAYNRTESSILAMQAAPPPLQLRGTSGFSDSLLQAAYKAFEAGAYASTERLLAPIPADDPRFPEVRTLLGQALFYSKKFEQAIPFFFEIRDTDRFERATAEWYLLLCFVAESRKYEANWMLDQIRRNPNHPYFAKADTLQKKMQTLPEFK